MERQKKNLIPTDKGKNLIAVLPEALTSPKMTAEWGHKLKQVERGELSGGTFLGDIAEFTKAVIKDNNVPKPEYVGLFSNKPFRSRSAFVPVVAHRFEKPLRDSFAIIVHAAFGCGRNRSSG